MLELSVMRIIKELSSVIHQGLGIIKSLFQWRIWDENYHRTCFIDTSETRLIKKIAELIHQRSELSTSEIRNIRDQNYQKMYFSDTSEMRIITELSSVIYLKKRITTELVLMVLQRWELPYERSCLSGISKMIIIKNLFS